MPELDDTRGDYSAARRAPRRDYATSDYIYRVPVVGSWVDDVAAARDKLEAAVESDVKVRLGIAAVVAIAATGLIVVLAKAADP